MNKKTLERIGMIAVIAAFVAYFCYQVAYGIEQCVTSNGHWACVTAAEGSKIGNITIVPEPDNTTR